LGEGFNSSVQTLSIDLGATAGVRAFGGDQIHDLALASLSYGRIVGGVCGKDRWYRGNWELRGRLFGGSQFSPYRDWVVGLTPHLRYEFATGTRWIPFVDAGFGLAATRIGPPDLCGTIEMNMQINAGALFFIRGNLALSLQAGYLHISDGDLHTPNLGLNGVTGMLGITRLF
jgi:hypothetical protein